MKETLLETLTHYNVGIDDIQVCEQQRPDKLPYMVYIKYGILSEK